MLDKWRPYLTQINHELASIRIDLALATDAPKKDKPYLLWVWIYFQSPRPDGLSSNEEASTLWAMEDVLVATLKQHFGPIFCGCITTLGRREFYFYHTVDQDLSELVATVLRAFPAYKFDTGSQRDETWNQYLNVLYPSDDQLDSIANADVLEIMAKEGDIHELSRPITHWLYFPSNDERRAFLTAASRAGFSELEMLPARSKDGIVYGVTVTDTDGITGAAIDLKTRALRTLAVETGGEYDGWEAQVTVSPEIF